MSVTLILLLRIVHLVMGVFWVGAVLLVAGFLEPTARALGPDASKFIQHLMRQKQLSKHITGAAVLTVLSGIWLYWILSSGFQMAWITSGMGLSLTVGGLLAIVALIIGFAVSRPTAMRMGRLGQEIQASGGPPSDAQRAQMQALQTRMRWAGRVSSVLLLLAVIGMAVARYLPGIL